MSAADRSLAERIQDEAIFGRLPLLPKEREYSTRGILSTGFAYAVAAWCFLIGGYSANVVGAVQGIVTLIAGCVVGVVMSAAASALACNRYGLEQIDFSKSCFGQRGAKAILVFYVINQIGWTGMILVMFGRGVTNVVGALGWTGGENVVRVAVLLGLVVSYAVIIRGVHVLNIFNSIVTPGLVIVTGFLFYAIFRGTSWHEIAALPPIDPGPSRSLNYILAFEYGLGAGFSWWPGIGFLTRNTDTQRNSFYPQVLTMGLGMGIVCCTGLLAGLRFRSFDPTVWMIQVGGPIFGAAALALVAIANISASAMMMYTAALSLRHVGFFKALPWPTLTFLSFAPVLAYALFPETLYENGSAFLAYNATMFAPISGVLLVDYFLLRRQRVNVSQIFEDHPDGHYRFVGGYNPLSLGCMVLGQVLYVYLLDPASGATHWPVQILTASGPAVLLPMVLYAIGARLWLIPRGLGGYGAPTAPIPLRQPNI